jgi:hypothetical protein
MDLSLGGLVWRMGFDFDHFLSPCVLYFVYTTYSSLAMIAANQKKKKLLAVSFLLGASYSLYEVVNVHICHIDAA